MAAWGRRVERAAWLASLVENERVDEAVALGWRDPYAVGPRRPTDAAIEAAWRELDAAVLIQCNVRARLAARLGIERSRKLRLFRVYARTETRAAVRLQHAAQRLLARRRAQQRWREVLDGVAPDASAVAARLQRAADLLESMRRAAERAAACAALHGTLYKHVHRGLLPIGWRYEERLVAVEDSDEGFWLCCGDAHGSSAAERRVRVSDLLEVSVHSALRFEFRLVLSGVQSAWLFRAPSQQAFRQWVRGLHELVAMEEADAQADAQARADALVAGHAGCSTPSAGAGACVSLTDVGAPRVGPSTARRLPPMPVQSATSAAAYAAHSSAASSEGFEGLDGGEGGEGFEGVGELAHWAAVDMASPMRRLDVSHTRSSASSGCGTRESEASRARAREVAAEVHANAVARTRALSARAHPCASASSPSAEGACLRSIHAQLAVASSEPSPSPQIRISVSRRWSAERRSSEASRSRARRVLAEVTSLAQGRVRALSGREPRPAT